MKASILSFESLFKSNKTWLSRIKRCFLLPIWIGFMSYLFLLLLSSSLHASRNSSFISTQFFVLNLDGWFVVLSNKIITF